MSESSDDILADRRYAWAMALAAEGDAAGAADLLGQVIERVPAWAPAWAALGEARDRLDDRPGALDAWRQAEVLDADGRFGAALQVARLAAAAPTTMPDAYVRALFDDYAPRFDRHLLEGLHYRAPERLCEALDRMRSGHVFAHALDLGCGTGLMARALGPRAKRLDGVDLSSAMVDIARGTGLYDRLSVGSLETALFDAPPAQWDLVLAADVFVYVGGLDRVLAGIFRVLAPDGLLAFTLQSLPEPPSDHPGFALGPDMRFAHAPHYAASTLQTAGFELLLAEPASVRAEKGLAVPGLVVLARRP